MSPPALGVHGNAIFHILPMILPAPAECSADAIFAVLEYPAAQRNAGTAQALHRVSRTWLNSWLRGDLLSAFKKNYWYGLPHFCAAALVAGSLSRTLRQGLAAWNAQFMSAFTAAPL